MAGMTEKEWRDAILARDGRCCTACGSTELLHTHHIRSRTKYPDERRDLDNGTTLCYACHRRAHGAKGTIRPPKTPRYSASLKTYLLNCSDAQRAWLKLESERLGISVAELIRRIIDKARGE